MRLWILVSLLIPLSACVLGVRHLHRFEAHSIADPNVTLASIPTRLGQWQVEKSELTIDVFESLGAVDSVNLILINEARQVSANIAIWTKKDVVGTMCPHHPKHCYALTGWETLESRVEKVDLGTGLIASTTFSLLQRQQERSVIGYTYAVGPHHFANDAEAKLVPLKLFGRSIWPPVTKFLVQVPSPNLEDGIDQGTEALVALVDWYHAADNSAENESHELAIEYDKFDQQASAQGVRQSAVASF